VTAENLQAVFRRFVEHSRYSLDKSLSLYELISLLTEQHFPEIMNEIKMIQTVFQIDPKECPFEGCSSRFEVKYFNCLCLSLKQRFLMIPFNDLNFQDAKLVADHFGKYHYQALYFLINNKVMMFLFSSYISITSLI
jgi:hypothetical protein